MGDSQSIFRKEFVNQKGILLPEEADALASVAEHLCMTLPNASKHFSFAIGTRRFGNIDHAPRLELALSYGCPDSHQEKYQQMIDIAAQPKDYLADLVDAQTYYDKSENALKNGTIIFSDSMSFAFVKDDGGWFILALKFKHTLSLESNTFSVVFLTGIVNMLYAMDNSNSRLRDGYNAFLAKCENWSVISPEVQITKWLNDSSFKNFAIHRCERSGPRKFFG